MNKKQYERLCQDTVMVINKINASKGPDYQSGSDDVLANFKRNAKELNMTPEQVWAVYAAKHWDAIRTYVKRCEDPGYVPSEPIEGRFDDLIVYSILAKGLVHDRRYSMSKKETMSVQYTGQPSRADSYRDVAGRVVAGCGIDTAQEPIFIKELQSLINRYSLENGSDTPDFVLAGYLLACLTAFNNATRQRDNYYNPAIATGDSNGPHPA